MSAQELAKEPDAVNAILGADGDPQADGLTSFGMGLIIH